MTEREKDIKFLEEMRGYTKSLLERSDITKLKMLDKMVGDWLYELQELKKDSVEITAWFNHHFPLQIKNLTDLFSAIHASHIYFKEDIDHDQKVTITIEVEE
jgi:hypothetical protein